MPYPLSQLPSLQPVLRAKTDEQTRKLKRKTRTPSTSVSYNPPSSNEEYNKNSPPYIPPYTTNDELNNVTKQLDYLAVRKPNRRTRNKKLRKKIKKSRRMR